MDHQYTLYTYICDDIYDAAGYITIHLGIFISSVQHTQWAVSIIFIIYRSVLSLEEVLICIFHRNNAISLLFEL